MSDFNETDADFLAAIALAAADAREHADEVDRSSRFPAEAVARLKQSGCLGAALPRNLGGRDVSLGALSQACVELSRACASTGMIFAMHQIQVGCMARHLGDSNRLRDFLSDLGAEGRLVASATSEEGVGGDIRRTVAALEPRSDGGSQFEKVVPAMSYGDEADAVLVTLRRSPDAHESDQVLLLVSTDRATLHKMDRWDTLGMRGTCSSGFRIQSDVQDDAILQGDFATIAAETMVPYAHILWAHCWLGIAIDSLDRCRKHHKTKQRSPSHPDESVWTDIANISADVSILGHIAKNALAEYVAIKDLPRREALSSFGYAIRINNTKVTASQAAVRACLGSMQTIGLRGYANGSQSSVNRHLRDVLSAPLMVSNSRIRQTNAQLLRATDGT